MNTKSLLEKANTGRLSDAEAWEVAETLVAGADGNVDRYSLLLILGRSGATRYEDVVARFLDSPADPMLASVAIQTLCSYWGMTTKYLQQVIAFCKKVPWDANDDVRLIAISISGEFLRSCDNSELLRSIFNTFVDKDERPLLRNAAYSALARAAGKGWDEIPSPKRMLSGPNYDSLVIDAAKRRMQVGT